MGGADPTAGAVSPDPGREPGSLPTAECDSPQAVFSVTPGTSNSTPGSSRITSPPKVSREVEKAAAVQGSIEEFSELWRRLSQNTAVCLKLRSKTSHMDTVSSSPTVLITSHCLTTSLGVLTAFCRETLPQPAGCRTAFQEPVKSQSTGFCNTGINKPFSLARVY